MAETLTQSEIDELLNALQAGTDEPEEPEEDDGAGQVKEYNFRTANKFPKEQMRMLEFIYENYAGRLSSYLSGTLRTMSDVKLLSIEEQTFLEFSNSVPSPVVLAIIRMDPLEGNSLLQISSTIAYEMVSRLFGGTGSFSDTEKSFTEIELSVIRRIINQILEIMDEAWEEALDVRSMLERIETSSQFTQIVASSEPIVIITMNVKIGDVEDIINLCIPHIAVQPVFKELSMHNLYSKAVDDEDIEEDFGRLSSNMSNINLTMRAVFDDTIGTVNDIVNLQIGDVIRVDHPVSKPITVNVEHIPKFKAHIGRHKSMYAVKIADIMLDEED